MEFKRNLTLLTDFYEITMANGYLENEVQNTISYFDMFFRKFPDDGGFAIMAGVEQFIEYIQNLHFTENDIAFIKNKKMFSESLLNIYVIFNLLVIFGQ